MRIFIHAFASGFAASGAVAMHIHGTWQDIVILGILAAVNGLIAIHRIMLEAKPRGLSKATVR